jgi:beta-N-acetylhexosaminidase
MEATPPEQRPPRRKPPGRPAPPPEVLARRIRARIPVSPLPWHWSRRLRLGALIAIVVLVAGGALASVLLQGDDDGGAGRAAAAVDASPEVRKLLGKMSLEEKASAVMVAGFDDPDRIPAADPGGILITAASWQGERKGKALTAKLRASGGRIPPLIVTQQEGGDDRALDDLPPAESELEVGALGTPAAAETWALATGKALEANGIDLNLAPVADVATLDSPVSDRAFSDDPAVVTALTAAAIRGCSKSGVACAVSHFPGLGAASGDVDTGPASVSLDAATLEVRDLPPFEAAFEEKVPAVMLSLAFYAAYDPVTPAALSPVVADTLLREQLGFKGVALTDDLSGGAIAAAQGAPEAAPGAIAAGADMVVVSDPAEADAARKAIEKAARDGSVPADRLDEAVARVLELKRKLGLL